MKFKSPKSLESRLFAAGIILLVLMGLLYGLASIQVAHERAHAPSGASPGVAVVSPALELATGILELAGLVCVILSALVSIFRTILPSKPQ